MGNTWTECDRWNQRSTGVVCDEKQSLLDQIKRVSVEMVALQKKELGEVLAGGSPDMSLRNIKVMRQLLMDRLRNHIPELCDVA
jgi:hypothetical protein